MSGFVFLRVRAHRLLPAAALLSVLLTTTVLTTLAAFSGAIGEAGLRQALRTRAAPAAALQVKAQLPTGARGPADGVVARGARRAFGGLPFTVRTLVRSGPYALPRALRSPGAARVSRISPTSRPWTAPVWPSRAGGKVPGVVDAVPLRIDVQAADDNGPPLYLVIADAEVRPARTGPPAWPSWSGARPPAGGGPPAGTTR
ncbi:hypothetical protein Spla01_05022 [Streptomyces platensis]|uniref:ABC transporter permease n=1 Tax=Streptomyces platensis TaxID=58346 RepID=A0ABX3XLZ7_STRPT|nr:hypothetical protein BG653_07165 [Streptomyces platensis]